MESIGKKTRKLQDVLLTCGYGLLVFSIWALTKSLIYSFYQPEIITQAIYYYFGIDIAVQGLSAGLIAFFVVDFCIKLFVGFMAIKEGKAEHNKKIAYLVLAILLMISCLVYIVYDVLIVFKTIDAISIISLCTDVFHLAILFGVVFSGMKLRKINKGRK